ncbi:YcxB family protein [Coprobacter sp.]
MRRVINTRSYKISGEQYLKILFWQYWRKRWIWFLLPVLVLSILGFYTSDIIYVIVILVFGAFPFLLLNAYFRIATRPHNRFLLLEKQMEIDDVRMVLHFENDKTEIVEWNDVIKVEPFSRYYLLYFDNNRFFYVPKDAFFRFEDRIWFEQEVLYKIIYRNRQNIS